MAQKADINAEVLHHVAVLAAGGRDTLPHCGAIITLLDICKLTHRQSYQHRSGDDGLSDDGASGAHQAGDGSWSFECGGGRGLAPPRPL